MIGIIFDVLLYPSRQIGVPDWLTVIIVALTAIHLYTTQNYDHWQKIGVPHAKPIPYVSAMYHLVTTPMVYLDKIYFAKLGPVYGTFFGKKPLLMVGDVDFVKEIAVKQFSNFVNHDSPVVDDNKLFAHFMTVMKFDQWKGMRNVVTPTFSGAKMKALVPTINTCAKTFADNLDSLAESGESGDLKKLSGHYALDAVAGSLFGVAINSSKESAEAAEKKKIDPKYKDDTFSAHALGAFAAQQNPMVMLLFMMPWLRTFAMKFGVKLETFGEGEHFQFFEDAVNNIMKMRKDSPNDKRVDFLALLLDAHNSDTSDLADDTTAVSALDDTQETAQQVKDFKIGKRELKSDEILANAILFFLAGYETTATAVAWALLNLASHPQTQEALFGEICDSIYDETDITYDKVCSMQYLDGVINETLRMYPPAPRTDRVCNKDTVVNGVPIKKDVWLFLSMYEIHHNEKYWPNPEKFRPERFLPGEKESIVPFSFVPFGTGPRNCIGQRLAYLEMKIALIHVIRRYKFTVDTNKTEMPIQLAKGMGMTSASKGIHLNVQRR